MPDSVFLLPILAAVLYALAGAAVRGDCLPADLDAEPEVR